MIFDRLEFQKFTDELLRLYSTRIQDTSITNWYPSILDWYEKSRDSQ